MADGFVSDVPPALCSQGKDPTVNVLPFACPHTQHGSSTNLGNSAASETLANHTSGSAPTMAKPLDSVLERPATLQMVAQRRSRLTGQRLPYLFSGSALRNIHRARHVLDSDRGRKRTHRPDLFGARRTMEPPRTSARAAARDRVRYVAANLDRALDSQSLRPLRFTNARHARATVRPARDHAVR